MTMNNTLLSFLVALGAVSSAFAQSTTTFTYQGRLTEAGNPANGDYDLQFTLYNAVSGPAAVGIPATNRPVAVSNGLFAVILDFGAGAFDGSPRWLQLGVRTNGSAAEYFTLSPRQFISFNPYSITALNLAGTLPGGGLAGTYTNAVTFANPVNSFAGSGAGLSGLNAANLASGTIGDARLSANVALLNANQTFAGANALTNSGNTLAGNGSALTALNAANVSSGTLADARLSGNVPLLNGTNAFAGDNRFAGALAATNANNILRGAFTGNLTGNVQGNVIGAASTATNFTGALGGDVTGTQGATAVASVGGQSAANVASGAIAANGASVANVPGAIVKRDASGNFAAGTIAAGSLSGDGSNVANLNAANVASGTLADARLSGNVPLLNDNQSFIGANTFGNAWNSFTGSFAGDSTGLTNLNGANIVSGTVGNAQLAANAVQTANIAAGAVGNTQLASGAAVANLLARGQSGVASDGVIWSRNPTSSNLVSAGYVRIGSFDIAPESWTQRSGANAPAPRQYATAVWTGNDMIVWGGGQWGGSSFTNLLNTGGRFSAVTKAWRTMSSAGADIIRALSILAADTIQFQTLGIPRQQSVHQAHGLPIPPCGPAAK
jgi:hypothetical protein